MKALAILPAVAAIALGIQTPAEVTVMKALATALLRALGILEAHALYLTEIQVIVE